MHVRNTGLRQKGSLKTGRKRGAPSPWDDYPLCMLRLFLLQHTALKR